MGLFEIAKSVGDAHGLVVPSEHREYLGDYDYNISKSKTWGMVDDALRGLDAAPRDGDYKAFLETYAVLPWIYVAAWLISTTISNFDWGIFEGRGSDSKELDKHEVLNLFEMPNQFDSFEELIELLVLNLELSGNGYWEKGGNLNGLPVQLFNLDPGYMKIRSDPKTKIAGYSFDYENGSPPIRYEPDEIVHFKYANPASQFYGQGAVKALQASLITELNRESFNRAFLENEARPDVVLKHTPDPDKGIRPLDKDDRDRLANEWIQKFKGPRKTRKPVVLMSGMDVSLLTEQSQDMQYAALEKSIRERVFGAMGTPPCLCQIYEYANYANSKEQLKIFHTVTIPPKCRKIESKIDREILAKADKNLHFRFKRDNIPALEEDPKDREERLAKRLDRGIINRNEYRSEMGQEKIDSKIDANADKYLILSGYMAVEDIFTQIPEEGEGEGGLFDA